MTILVTGATGTVGRRVVEHLVQNGHSVRALTRNPEKATFPQGVEVVGGNLSSPETLAGALEGVTGLHLINFDAGDGFGGYAPLETGPEIVRLAAKAGVQRITVLRGGDDPAVEQAVMASDLEWTIIDPMEFMAGALDWTQSIRDERVVREPYGGRMSAMVHEGDIGAVIGTVLAQGGHGGKTLSLSGPEVLSLREKVSTISDAIGHEIQLVELTEEQAVQQWKQQGMPDEVIEFFIMALGNTPEDGYTVVPTVEQVTGRPARTFAQWAAEHAEVFRA